MPKPLPKRWPVKDLMCLAESRGYTASHQVLTRHGDLDSGAGARAAQRLEEAGIITNMNMLPGDTKALSPSGLRLGVQELTRVGFTNDDMKDVARFYARFFSMRKTRSECVKMSKP